MILLFNIVSLYELFLMRKKRGLSPLRTGVSSEPMIVHWRSTIELLLTANTSSITCETSAGLSRHYVPRCRNATTPLVLIMTGVYGASSRYDNNEPACEYEKERGLDLPSSSHFILFIRSRKYQLFNPIKTINTPIIITINPALTK